MNTEQHEPVLKNAEDEPANSEYSINYLKEELNKVVWMYAAANTTLREAEEIANELLAIFTRNREKHGMAGQFNPTA